MSDHIGDENKKVEPQPVAWLAEEKSIWTDGEWQERPFVEQPEGPRYRNIRPLYDRPYIAGDGSEHSAELRVAVALWRQDAESGTPASIAMGRTIDTFADMLNPDDQERWLLKARAALRALARDEDK